MKKIPITKTVVNAPTRILKAKWRLYDISEVRDHGLPPRTPPPGLEKATCEDIEMYLRESVASFVFYGLAPGSLVESIITGEYEEGFHRSHANFRILAEAWENDERRVVETPEGSIYEQQYHLIRHFLPESFKDSKEVFNSWLRKGLMQGGNTDLRVQFKLTELDKFWRNAGGWNLQERILTDEMSKDLAKAIDDEFLAEMKRLTK